MYVCTCGRERKSVGKRDWSEHVVGCPSDFFSFSLLENSFVRGLLYTISHMDTTIAFSLSTQLNLFIKLWLVKISWPWFALLVRGLNGRRLSRPVFLNVW